MKMKHPSLFLLFVLFFLPACASVKPSGYLDNYSSLKSAAPLKKGLADSELKFQGAQSLFVQAPKLAQAGIKVDNIQSRVYSKEFAKRLGVELQEAKLFQQVAVETNGDTYNGQDYVLETYIATLNPGNGFMRWAVGMGAGYSDIQIEGKLIDKSKDKVVLQFADRRRESGNPMLGFNVSAMNNDKQVNRSLDHITEGIVAFFKRNVAK
jgi:hypothetical protein